MSGRTVSCAIPSRRVHINDPSQLPHEYSATPGGTLFSTTPGGTRIIYERNFLLQMRNSPLTKTPPKNLPVIPGVTTQATTKRAENKTIPEHEEAPKAQEDTHKPKVDDDDQQFQMDI